MIRFVCTQCHRKIGVPDEDAGRRCKCPDCGTVLKIPRAPQPGPKPMHLMADLAALDDGPPTPMRELPGALPSLPTSHGRTSARVSATGDAESFDMPALKWSVLGGMTVIAAMTLLLGNLVTGLFFLFVLLAMINGYWFGASKVAAVFGGLIAAALLAAPLGRAFEGLTASILGTTGMTNRMISIALFAVVIVIGATALLQMGIGQWMKRKPHWRPFDRPLGACLGIFEGTLLGFLIIWSILSLEPIAAAGAAAAQEPDAAPNPAAQAVVAIAHSAHESAVGQIASAVNPMRDIRVFSLFEKVLIVLNNPAARDAFANHPAVAAIQERPTVQKAMEMLKADPDLMAIIESKDGITGEGLRKILDSDTVLHIVDRTAIVAEISPMIDQIQQAVDDAFALAQQHRADDPKLLPGEPTFFGDSKTPTPPTNADQ
ncbi:MAG: hypothetical protein GC162_07905 [Planctomycetes bacterium]|nr:hypothetical protein [Planctomycetota bacterium]